jgi:hypothetical protein
LPATARPPQAIARPAGTSVLPDDRDHYAHLIVKDGLQTWE